MKTTKTNIRVFQTSDTKLASFLITSGHLPMSPPLIKKEIDGKTRGFWRFDNFEELNQYGRTLDQSLGVWKKGIKHIEENPKDYESKIMQALKTFDYLTAQFGRDDLENTLVFYTIDGNTFSAVKGSKKEEMLKRKAKK